MKFSVTPELALLLKTMSAQCPLPAKTVAEQLGKSPSYVSKLENGEVKSIQKDVLAHMLTILSGEEDFFEGVLPAAMKVLHSFLDPQRLVNQVWLLQFDIVERKVAVPSSMAEDINRNLTEVKTSLKDLVRLTNSNIDSELTAAFPANEVACIDYEGTPRFVVRVEVAENDVVRAFKSETPILSYSALHDLVFNMFRLLNYPDMVGKMPPEQAKTVLRCTSSYMDQFNIHSLTGFSHLLSSEEFITRQEPLSLTTPRIVGRISEELEELSQHDQIGTTRQLNTFFETLSWDSAFALKLMSIPFSDLGEMGFRAKRALLEEIQALVDKYDQLPESEKRREEY